MIRLNVNIDHIATVREARKSYEPNLVAAASLADIAGADGVTVHLRGDRRHIQDADVYALRAAVKTHLNVEMAATPEMVRIACEVKPSTATLVPERLEEITTEGGLDAVSNESDLRAVTKQLSESGVLVSLFVDPIIDQVEAAARIGAKQIEICTSRYSDLTNPTGHPGRRAIEDELKRIGQSARRAGELGLQVAAGHGLTYRNVLQIAQISPMEELNIGHNIVSRAVLVGLERAVKEMIAAIRGQLI